VALGARMIEKHFTDDTKRVGPDHAFSMDPKSWRDMVDRTRELEYALGTGVKKVEGNEKETVIVQRRSIRAKKSLTKGQLLSLEDLEVLRPCPLDGIPPYEIKSIVGKKIRSDIHKGAHLTWKDID
ncbi:MAG: N-acetylneuraminate synthase family protein, partial [Leptospiraceae bacterium]|nr:N-acetylneuraminate synthase family protein [Leptospiraceae bacterium]